MVYAKRRTVGGEILELALSRAKDHARFVICGGTLKQQTVSMTFTDTSPAVSQYNSSKPQGPKVVHTSSSLIANADV